MTPKKNNRERILVESVQLFNLHGVVPITTNHIADHLKISPGNLYFHFRNKEEIIRELFQRMCSRIYEIWGKPARLTQPPQPVDLLEQTMTVFWEFRFFHREMYHLRRKDPGLSKGWKSHLVKTYRLLKIYYSLWIDRGMMKPVQDPVELRLLSDVVLVVANAFLNFYESPDHPASTKALNQGVQMVSRLLIPYHQGQALRTLQARLNS